MCHVFFVFWLEQGEIFMRLEIWEVGLDGEHTPLVELSSIVSLRENNNKATN